MNLYFHFELQQDAQWNPVNLVPNGPQNNEMTDWLSFCSAIIHIHLKTLPVVNSYV